MKTPLLGPALPGIPINAGSIGVSDPGGAFGGPPLTAQDIFDLIGTGGLTGYLTVIGGGKGTVEPLGTLGAAKTIDLTDANLCWGTLDQDCDISTTSWTNGKDCQILVEIIGDGTSTPTFLGVTWKGDAPGVIGAGDYLHVALWSRDGGTTIWAAVVGGGSGIDVSDEGTPLTTALASLNFVGSGVTATAVGNAVTVTILGPADVTQVWMPLTTVVAGVPELVWDLDNSLIPTLVPI